MKRKIAVSAIASTLLLVGLWSLTLTADARSHATAPGWQKHHPHPKPTHTPTPTPTPTATPSPTPTATATPTPTPTLAPTPSVLPNFSHVFVIVMENEEASSIIGNPAAAYINRLANGESLATSYFAIGHPSLPNYLALTAGSTFGISTDCTGCYVNAGNLADQIESSGRSWKAYMESMPSNCYVGDAYPYMQKHDPFIYYDNIRTNAARCGSHVVPFGQFSADVAANTLPNFSWITPNMCDDMHDCSIATGDTWLAGVVPSILASSAFKNGGALFITWDEGSTNAGCCGNAAGGRVATLVVAPNVVAGLHSTTNETHYSLLRTIEDAWGLSPLGQAANASAMREYFH